MGAFLQPSPEELVRMRHETLEALGVSAAGVSDEDWLLKIRTDRKLVAEVVSIHRRISVLVSPCRDSAH